MILVLLLGCCALVARAALPDGMGGLTVTTDKATYSTDGVITVNIAPNPNANGTIPADDTMFQLVVRKCDAIIESSCSDDKYKQWKTQPFATLASTETTKTITIDTSWPTSKYYISIESTKYGGIGAFGSTQYIYGMTPRFTVTYTKGGLFLTEPVASSTWRFDVPTTVVWRTDDMPGGETVTVSLKDTKNQNIMLGNAVQTKEGGMLRVTPVAAWGVGGVTLRIALSGNDAIFDDVVFTLAEPEAYYDITEPNALSNWRGGTMVRVAWTPKNIKSGVTCVVTVREPTNQDSFMITAQPVPSTANSVMWMVPNDIQYTSNGWIVEINDNAVKSRSAAFQITSSQPPGDCQIMKLQREMNLHDQMVCKKTPTLLVAGPVRILSVTVEWLFCIDDRLRVTFEILGPGGTSNVVAFRKIGADPTRVIDVLMAAEHGADADIVLRNIRREDLSMKKALIADVQIYPYSTEKTPNGPPGITLRTAMRLEMTDPMCKCPYEDPTAPRCITAPVPCIDVNDPACQGPCVPNDTRAKCLDEKRPRDSIYNVNGNVCSAGLAINVHSTPCQTGDKLLFTIMKKSTQMTVLNKQELPGCDKYWLNVRTAQGTGYVISSLVKLCQISQPINIGGDASSLALSMLLSVAALLAALV